MCEFISWIEFQGKIYFLDDTKLRTEKGQKLLSQCTNDDIIGHGAIMEYFGLTRHQGIHKECTYFSDPKNFPEEIVEAIKMGLFRNFGVCGGILMQPADKEYGKIARSAWKEYDKIERSAWEEYGKIAGSARKEYIKIERTAWKKCERIRLNSFWDFAVKAENRREIWT